MFKSTGISKVTDDPLLGKTKKRAKRTLKQLNEIVVK